ncbi:MAG: glycoside hydrolase family 15 protein [Candidatus Obscuribacterales bacterium]|nr:glycoside hydrolase family 15 protein [Candidatus Obscuribacterales bacterium]
MPRDLPVGNGKILINFDKSYGLRDIYYPHVGQENQTIGHLCRFGVWVDGQFAWVGDEWHLERKYMKETLVTDVLLRNETLGLELVCHDLVDYIFDIYLREIHVKDLSGKERNVRLFFHHDFYISENEVGDTAFYDPRTEAVIHYKKNRWFLANCSGTDKWGVERWAVGKKAMDGMEGTWRDAEDGELGGNAIVQGSVDSTVGTSVRVPAHGQAVAHYWIAFGECYEDLVALDKTVKDSGPAYFVPRNQNYWRLWVNPEYLDFQSLPPKIIDLYKRSLLVIRTQVDRGGAIIAANDHDIVQFARDTYSYMWPRDGALVASALTRAGYRDIAHGFYRFCAAVIKKEGYLLHKYNPDKTLASSWHPWLRDGRLDLPIQEDETALVLWSMWQHFRKHRDVEYIRESFESLVQRAADFLCRFRNPETKLPFPSHDLWEERYGVHLFTVASVIGGLKAAASFAHAFGESELHAKYEQTAHEVKEAMLKYMWNEQEQRFCRMATPTENGYEQDMTIDAAMYAVFAFGALPPQDPKVQATMEAIRRRLWVKTDVGGVARYENDYYHQVSQDIENVPGNPWFICTMWLAQYDIASAKSPESLKSALEIMEWVADRALPSGVLAEQVHPYTNEPLSVSPLTWSHATFVMCVSEYLEKRRQLMAEAVFAHTIMPV